jgi:hypothetical protein
MVPGGVSDCHPPSPLSTESTGIQDGNNDWIMGRNEGFLKWWILKTIGFNTKIV